MAQNFPNPETTNWEAFTGSGVIPSPTLNTPKEFDTGESLLKIQGQVAGAGSAVSIQSTNESVSATGMSKSLFLKSGANGKAVATIGFGDDTGQSPGIVQAADGVTFKIYDIQAARGYADNVVITAYYQGTPVTVSATPGTSFSVSGSGTNTVTLKGTSGFTSVSGSSSTITFGGLVDTVVITHTGGGGSSQVYVGNISFTPYGIVCFVAGTIIRTPTGEVAVEALEVGDLVMTRDNGAQPVRWIDSTRRALRAGSRLAPVRIRAGALGDNLPESDLLVSPQHRMLVRSAIAQRMFGTDEVLVAAKQLLQIDGIDIADDLDEVVYVHFIFDRHEIVYANGAESESLYTGPEALKTLSPQAREEILALFPKLAEDALPEPARVLASGRLGRKLAVRHAQDDKPVVG